MRSLEDRVSFEVSRVAFFPSLPSFDWSSGSLGSQVGCGSDTSVKGVRSSPLEVEAVEVVVLRVVWDDSSVAVEVVSLKVQPWVRHRSIFTPSRVDPVKSAPVKSIFPRSVPGSKTRFRRFFISTRSL